MYKITSLSFLSKSSREHIIHLRMTGLQWSRLDRGVINERTRTCTFVIKLT